MRDQDRIAEIRRLFDPWADGNTPRERLMLEAIWHLLNQLDADDASLRALVQQWREEAAAEQRVSFCADQLERLITGAE